MLWFIHLQHKYLLVLLLFKYILCYGSSSMNRRFCLWSGRFKYILCYGSSWSDKLIRACTAGFKYILCYGSSSFWTSILLYLLYLNTSYVMVHPVRPDLAVTVQSYLNTSYVMVHRIVRHVGEASDKFKYILCYGSSFMFYIICICPINLNTSYVMVHQSCAEQVDSELDI